MVSSFSPIIGSVFAIEGLRAARESGADLLNLEMFHQIISSFGLQVKCHEQNFIYTATLVDREQSPVGAAHFYNNGMWKLVLTDLNIFKDSDRGKGLGTFLIVYLVCFALREEMEAIQIDSVTEEGCCLYAKLGFIPDNRPVSDGFLMEPVDQRRQELENYFCTVGVTDPRARSILLHLGQSDVLDKVRDGFERAVEKRR